MHVYLPAQLFVKVHFHLVDFLKCSSFLPTSRTVLLSYLLLEVPFCPAHSLKYTSSLHILVNTKKYLLIDVQVYHTYFLKFNSEIPTSESALLSYLLLRVKVCILKTYWSAIKKDQSAIFLENFSGHAQKIYWEYLTVIWPQSQYIPQKKCTFCSIL